jgi:uncharacterized membrane protein YhiD involved in acid resistance
VTAIFATGLILLCLYLLGGIEQKFSLKMEFHTYEVTGADAIEVAHEVNRVLEPIHSIPQNVQTATTKQHVRVQFDVEGTSKEQEKALHCLKQSPLLANVTALGAVSPE